MTPRWEDGEVAVITAANRTKPYRAIYDAAAATWRDTSGSFCVDQPVTHRPLLVIDLQDWERLEQVTRALHDRHGKSVSSEPGVSSWDLAVMVVQDALRELLKPPAPTGLGAIVEDADGHLHTLVRAESAQPFVGSDGRWRSYADITAVRVVRAGLASWETGRDGAGAEAVSS